MLASGERRSLLKKCMDGVGSRFSGDFLPRKTTSRRKNWSRCRLFNRRIAARPPVVAASGPSVSNRRNHLPHRGLPHGWTERGGWADRTWQGKTGQLGNNIAGTRRRDQEIGAAPGTTWLGGVPALVVTLYLIGYGSTGPAFLTERRKAGASRNRSIEKHGNFPDPQTARQTGCRRPSASYQPTGRPAGHAGQGPGALRR